MPFKKINPAPVAVAPPPRRRAPIVLEVAPPARARTRAPVQLGMDLSTNIRTITKSLALSPCPEITGARITMSGAQDVKGYHVQMLIFDDDRPALFEGLDPVTGEIIAAHVRRSSLDVLLRGRLAGA